MSTTHARDSQKKKKNETMILTRFSQNTTPSHHLKNKNLERLMQNGPQTEARRKKEKESLLEECDPATTAGKKPKKNHKTADDGVVYYMMKAEACLTRVFRSDYPPPPPPSPATAPAASYRPARTSLGSATFSTPHRQPTPRLASRPDSVERRNN